MKKPFETPEVEILKIQTEDILDNSGTPGVDPVELPGIR